MARYHVKTQRRSPSNPNSSVSYYNVVDSGAERDGKPAVVGVGRFSVGQHGSEEALRLANALCDDLNADVGAKNTPGLNYPCKITIYRFVGDKAYTHREVSFDKEPVEAMKEALAAVRQGLPPDFGATLCDARGYNVR